MDADIERDLKGLVEGDVRMDLLTRTLYATDASIYRATPIGVVMPKTAADVVAVCRQDGQTAVIEGPCPAASQVGELLILDARDLNHAIQLLSLHPALALGGFEIRPQAGETPAGFTLSAQGESR